MKKIIFSFLLVFSVTNIVAQSSSQIIPNKLKVSEKHITPKIDPVSVNLNASNKTMAPTVVSRVYQNGMQEEIIGNTYYDLQTNAAIQNRVVMHDDQSISAVWTMSPNQNTGFPDRGTGYNYYDGSTWGDLPTVRVETERTGWPSIDKLKEGEIMASHVFGDPDYHTTITSRQIKGTGTWSEALLPQGPDAYDNVWPRMKVGGPDGQSVHLISQTYSLDNNYISYSRSLDGGANWDITDYIIPGIGPDYYNGFAGDAYALDVKGETVAFVLGATWTDVILMKSIDNGSTWTKTIVKEHPIPFYTDSIIVDSTTFPETGGIIDNADQSFSLSLDNDGNAHIFYGLMGYANSDTTDDGGYSYYPTTDGLVYWSELTQQEDTIAYVLDQNANDTLDIESIDNIGYYGCSMTSHPSSTIDENGVIYLAYSSVIEIMYDDQIDFGNDGTENYLQHYRHIYTIKSEDNGATWTDPYDLMAILTDPDTGDPINEGVFPSISNIVDGKLAITYQRDYLPGLHVQGDEDPITNNNIVCITINTGDYDNLSIEKLRKSSHFDVYPNPTSDMITVSSLNHFEDEVSIKVINLLGSVVYSHTTKDSEHNFNMEHLSNGVYLVSVEDKNNKVVKRIIKH